MIVVVVYPDIISCVYTLYISHTVWHFVVFEACLKRWVCGGVPSISAQRGLEGGCDLGGMTWNDLST